MKRSTRFSMLFFVTTLFLMNSGSLWAAAAKAGGTTAFKPSTRPILSGGATGPTSAMIAELTPKTNYKTFGSSDSETYLSRVGVSFYSMTFSSSGSKNLSQAYTNDELYFDADDSDVIRIDLVAQDGPSSGEDNEYFIVVYGALDSNSSTGTYLYLEDESDSTVAADDVTCKSSTSEASFKIISNTFTVPTSSDGSDYRSLEIKASGLCRGDIDKIQVFRKTS